MTAGFSVRTSIIVRGEYVVRSTVATSITSYDPNVMFSGSARVSASLASAVANVASESVAAIVRVRSILIPLLGQDRQSIAGQARSTHKVGMVRFGSEDQVGNRPGLAAVSTSDVVSSTGTDDQESRNTQLLHFESANPLRPRPNPPLQARCR